MKNNYKYIGYVTFKEVSKKYTFGSNNKYEVNDKVVVETIRGLELGTLVEEMISFNDFKNKNMEIKSILRKANDKDLANALSNKEAAKSAMVICQEKIEKLKLDMNLIEAEYTLDRSKIIFVYVADERVDFRDLLKELANNFKCRIELRQIGPRNKAKIVGGLGCCGMETCCSRFLDNFDVVSINMAKNQLLALNIQKLSGQCGKLMCCLKFEDDMYKELKQGLPKINSQVEYKGKTYRLSGMNVLIRQAKIENREEVQFIDFAELWPDKEF